MSVGIWEGNKAERVAKALESIARGGDAVSIDATYGAMLTGANTSGIFKRWWPLSDGSDSRYERLERFGQMMAAAWNDKKYTLRYTLPELGSASAMVAMDDLAGKSAAQLCLDTTTPVTDWADEDPMTWYVRANALSLKDGTMNVLAVEGVDAEFDVSGENAPVYTFCLALWYREWEDAQYSYRSWATVNQGGYRPYAGDVAPDNTKRVLTWKATFPGGYDSQGRLGSGAGQKPYNRKSANQGIASARTVTAYEGLWNDADTIWALHMWQLRHFNLENSEILNGCQSYSNQHAVALAETGVRRVLVTTAQGANFYVGSNIMVGERGANTAQDRGRAYMFDICDNATILSKETVTIDGTEYTALNLDLDDTIDLTATCWVSTAPWNSGVTEALPGHKDGTLFSLTGGKAPIRVQGVEVQDGAYTIGLDPLYDVTNFADSKSDYTVYECRDSEKLSGSITGDYENTGISFSQMPQGWNYVKKFVKTARAVLFPDTIGGSSTGYYKSAFYGPYSAGVRCPWRFGHLFDSAHCGLACENGYNAPAAALWHGRPRLGGSGKKRGEWAA